MTASNIERVQGNTKNAIEKGFLTLEYSHMLFRMNDLILEQTMSLIQEQVRLWKGR